MNWLIPLAIAAQLGDLSTTALGLHRGCQEVTYPVKNEAGILAMKGSALGFTLVIYPKLHREHPKFTKWVFVSLIASGVAATAINLHTLPACHP
jgi:hypothetical protein